VPEETTGEETTYIDQIEFERLHPEKIVLKRLVKAEREALFYMLEDMGAVKYFEDHIDSILLSALQRNRELRGGLREKRKEPVDVKSLLGDIASSGAITPMNSRPKSPRSSKTATIRPIVRRPSAIAPWPSKKRKTAPMTARAPRKPSKAKARPRRPRSSKLIANVRPRG
jgi:hypothetical protein